MAHYQYSPTVDCAVHAMQAQHITWLHATMNDKCQNQQTTAHWLQDAVFTMLPLCARVVQVAAFQMLTGWPQEDLLDALGGTQLAGGALFDRLEDVLPGPTKQVQVSTATTAGGMTVYSMACH